MQISIAVAVNLKSQLEKKVNELYSERDRVATETVDKGEKGQIPERNVDIITGEAERVEDHILALKAALRAANQAATVAWNDKTITMYEALDLAKLLRARADRSKKLGNRKKLERNSARGIYGGDSNTFTVALYDPEIYKLSGMKLERLANKLSAAIEEANHANKFEFAPADEYLA